MIAHHLSTGIIVNHATALLDGILSPTILLFIFTVTGYKIYLKLQLLNLVELSSVPTPK